MASCGIKLYQSTAVVILLVYSSINDPSGRHPTHLYSILLIHPPFLHHSSWFIPLLTSLTSTNADFPIQMGHRLPILTEVSNS